MTQQHDKCKNPICHAETSNSLVDCENPIHKQHDFKAIYSRFTVDQSYEHDFIKVHRDDYLAIQAALRIADRVQSVKGSVLTPSYGDTMVFQHKNMWGELCNNIYEYGYAGKFGKYPNYTHRFCRIGEASVAKDGFDDLIINFEDYKDEKIGVQGKIVSYKKAMSAQLLKEVCDEC